MSLNLPSWCCHPDAISHAVHTVIDDPHHYFCRNNRGRIVVLRRNPSTPSHDGGWDRIASFTRSELPENERLDPQCVIARALDIKPAQVMPLQDYSVVSARSDKPSY